MSYSRALFSKEELIKGNMAHAARQCEKKMTSEKEVTFSSKIKETKMWFRWSALQIEQLIDCISAYKSKF